MVDKSKMTNLFGQFKPEEEGGELYYKVGRGRTSMNGTLNGVSNGGLLLFMGRLLFLGKRGEIVDGTCIESPYLRSQL